MSDLFTTTGQRKYLTDSERTVFLNAAQQFPREIRVFCETLHFTGCRISEALALTPERVDFAGGLLVFRTLKQREKVIQRGVPVPDDFLDRLDLVFNLKAGGYTQRRLWRWSRTTAWRQVRAVMDLAGIQGAHAKPKGLRHGYGVSAVLCGVPVNLIQRWMGHAQLTTTAIYLEAMGEEERALAAKMWSEV